MEISYRPHQINQPTQLGADMTYMVSNSEVGNYLSCERKHYYAHALNIEPINHGTSLSRGIIGHEALAEYYQHVKDGSTDAVSAMNAVVDRYMLQEFTKPAYLGQDKTLEMLGGLKILLERYIKFQVADHWNILAVEESYTMDLVDQYGYVMRLDLLVQYTEGPRAGEIWIVDHKFVYDFYDANTLMINSQIPKYLATVRNATGLVIQGGMLNMIRWRQNKGPMADDALFRRETLTPSTKKIRNIMREQMLASQEIIERHALPVEEYSKVAKRTLNQMVCKNCSFLSVCMTELDGEDASLMLQTEYKPNTYGYNGLGAS